MHLLNVMGCLGASTDNHEQKKLLRVMRLTAILILAACMQLSARGISQQVTLSVKNTSLDKVFIEIRKQTGFEFFYNTTMLQKAKKVSLDVKNASITRVLDLCFSDQPFDYVVYNKTIVVKQKEPKAVTMMEQTSPPVAQKVTGRVTDENAQPLEGASVTIVGETGGVTTDANGRFEIMVPNLKATLVVSYVGFTKQEIALNGRSTIDVSLKSVTASMNDLIVVGYGTVRRKDVTGSVSTVKFDEKEAAQITNIDRLLQGRAAGVEVNTGSAAPGGAINVRIRGLSSISGGTEPLYVVDGIIVNTAMQDNTNSLKVGTNPGNSYQEVQTGLTAINPQDIESIEILKDASATAIYGSRGANGVVLITTKQGKAGKGKITFSSSLEFAQVSKKMDMLDGYEYANFINKTRPAPGPYYDLNTIQPIDWQDDIFRTGITSNNRVTLSGRTERSNYYLGLGYLNNNGVIPTTGVKQGDLRFNFTQDVTQKLRVSTRTSLLFRRNSMTQSTEQLGSAGQSIIRQILAKQPILDSAGSTINLDQEVEGPRAWLKEYDDITKEFRVLQSLSAEYRLSNAFTIRTLGGADVRFKDRRRWFGKDLSQGQLTNGQLGVSTLRSYSYNLEAMLLFNKTYGKHRFNGTGGMTYDNSDIQNAYTVNEDFFTEDLRIYGMGTGAKVYPQFEDFTKSSILSGLARMVYTYNDKYVVTATGRFDGTSRFAEGNKWGFFPSIAVAWRASDEDFIKNLNIFSTLKPRFGYGLTGNQAINPYSTIARYKAAYYSTSNGSVAVGAIPDVLANPNLTWESSSQLNLGVDAGVLNDRVTFTVDLYHKKTNDLLQDFKIPISAGFTSIAANKGSIENKGIELTAQGLVIDKKIKWNIGGNIAFNKNKIVDIGQPEGQFGSQTLRAFYGVKVAGGTEFATPANIFAEGYPVGMFFGFQTRGIYQPDDLARDPLKFYGVAMQAGDIYFVDKNGDGNITDLDKDFIGDPNPRFTYGITSSVSYKRLSLNVFANGVNGNKIANGNLLKIENTSLGTNITKSAYYDAWSATNPGGTKPRLLYVNKDFTDRIVEDGSFFRLAMVTLSYRIPVQTSWLSAFDVYVTGRNLLTITKYSGYDPEVNSFTFDPMRRGVDWSSYPNTRSIVFGLNATF